MKTDLLNSYLKAFKIRKNKTEAIKYKFNLEDNLINFHNKLYQKKYVHSKYNNFIVLDSKKREINSPIFEDHILHHYIFNDLNLIYEKKFKYHIYVNRKNKGTHKAILNLKKHVNKYLFYLKMDIEKYFQNINHKILFNQIKREIKNEFILNLIELIIKSYNFKIGKGIPIGNVISQLFANIYLHDLDFYIEHKIKSELKKKGVKIFYIRYVDDFIILSNNKNKLKQIRDKILIFLKEKLKLNVPIRKQDLNYIKTGINFLGYILFKDRIKIKNNTIRRFKKRIKYYPKKKLELSLQSFKGHCDISNKNFFLKFQDKYYLRVIKKNNK